jgi:hypothetical protein
MDAQGDTGQHEEQRQDGKGYEDQSTRGQLIKEHLGCLHGTLPFSSRRWGSLRGVQRLVLVAESSGKPRWRILFKMPALLSFTRVNNFLLLVYLAEA